MTRAHLMEWLECILPCSIRESGWTNRGFRKKILHWKRHLWKKRLLKNVVVPKWYIFSSWPLLTPMFCEFSFRSAFIAAISFHFQHCSTYFKHAKSPLLLPILGWKKEFKLRCSWFPRILKMSITPRKVTLWLKLWHLCLIRNMPLATWYLRNSKKSYHWAEYLWFMEVK